MAEAPARIHLLDATTIGQIAAGEVIERPASVVKELVENALDAGARRILVAVDGGGLERIEVVDDGAGIAAEDVPLAVRRHATSKLAAAGDLERVRTLGFRGEGLASIAAVSVLELFSRRGTGPVGARVTAHGEDVSAAEPAAGPPGTSVRVSDLFANVPVRREYVRSAPAEFARISTFLSTIALAYPEVTFSLRHDGKDVWTMPATSDVRERLHMVFGRDAAAALIPLAETDRTLDGTIRGFISAPGNDRADRRLQLHFVNGRTVRAGSLAGAWTAGYSTFAMLGRQPFGALFLDLAPENVDANVHPTKSEVRFRYNAQVADAVRRTIAATLREHAAARYAQHAGIGPAYSASPAQQNGGGAEAPVLFEDEATAGDAPALRVLAQLDLTYILAADGDALLLVDQHAAHERIAYESIVARATNGGPSEPLLLPLVVELDAQRSAALADVVDALRQGGLEIEPFGERAYRIVATPAGYAARAFDLAGFLDDLTEDPKQRGVRERIWASLACHSVTVAGERLEPQEMTTLVARLQRCANPMHCPHGRPTMVRLGAAEIARLFKR